jgi:hypothetical protein
MWVPLHPSCNNKSSKITVPKTFENPYNSLTKQPTKTDWWFLAVGMDENTTYRIRSLPSSTSRRLQAIMAVRSGRPPAWTSTIGRDLAQSGRDHWTRLGSRHCMATLSLPFPRSPIKFPSHSHWSPCSWLHFFKCLLHLCFPLSCFT